jgi:uncharacterized protein (DUF58 family)
VKRRASPKLGAYAGLAALGLLAGLVLRRVELVVLAAPFALVLVAGLALARTPRVGVRFALGRDTLLEEEETEAVVELASPSPVERLDLVLVLPAGIELAEGRSPWGLRLPPAEPRRHELRLRAARWGGYTLGELVLRARDPFGLFAFEQRVRAAAPLRVYPRPERLSAPVAPLETQPFAGNLVSREKGEGIEFADLRPFAPGDRVRRVNWRASARRGSIWVNESHPERNADVILFLDTFVEARRAGGHGTLELAVRAATSLAEAYLRRKDRVGVASFGGVLSWLLPATGLVQRYRIADALIATEVTMSYAWKDVDVIPRGVLPAKALVLALSPLLDERAVRALLDLRARGFDLAIVEVSPVAFATPGTAPEDALAHRLWLLRREAVRGRYRAAGVPVVEWREDASLAAALEEVKSFRRSARPGRL